ncbi:MAG: hypothetical protein JNK15_07570, partial [Planctomycetes bacterium]|nr:hypothetical protein [Planctomycetota bacterium]
MNHDHDPFSPAERDQLAQELLELHFGCHEDPTALEARIAAEPALRALQREVLLQAKVLERAVRPEQAPLRLRPPTPASRWRWLRSPLHRIGALAAAAVVVLGTLFGLERTAHFRYTGFQQSNLHLTVSSPKAIPAGAPWSFTVQTKDLTGADVDSRITWEALAADGKRLAVGEAGTRSGAATVAMAADLQVPARVVVTARGERGEATQTLSLSTADAGPLVHLSTDRPVYRPGEAVHVRAVVLDRVTRLPKQQPQQLQLQLLDARDAPVATQYESATPGGVGSFLLPIPNDSAGGPHKVVLHSVAGDFPPETAGFVVRAFQNPQLQKEIVLDRASYAPGARGAATVAVQRLAGGGGPASGALAKGTLVVDGTEVWTGTQAIGPRGDATFAFTVPKDVQKGAARFVATITDGGIVETEVKPFVVPTGKVTITPFPEGGELVAGVENGLYVECADPLGRPVDGAGELLDARGRPVATWRTAHQGRARLAFVPRASESYSLRMSGHSDTAALPAVRDHGIAMVLRGDDIAAGAPLRLALAGRGDGPWLLGVFCRGVLVGQTTMRAGDGGELRTTVDVPLPTHAAGVLRATVFDRKLQPVAERLVRRQASERLDVALAVDRDAGSPGERRTVTVRTRDEAGRPTPSVVGLSVSDLATLSLGSEPAIGLVDHAMLFADVERTENLGDFVLAHTGSATNVDLLLGTRGWRRFVWRNDAEALAAIAARGKPAEGILAREGFSHTPQVVSNLAAARAPGQELQRFVWQTERWLANGFAFTCFVLVVLLLFEALAAGARHTLQVNPWVQVLAGVTGVGLLLSLWLPNVIGGSNLAVEAEDLAWGVSPAPTTMRTPPVPQDFALYLRDFDVETAQGSALGTWGVLVGTVDPAANPLAGLFYNDGGDADIRARTENFFGTTFVRPGPDVRLSVPGDDRPLFDTREEVGMVGILGYRYIAPRDYARDWAQRQYAHTHTPSDERTDFTATVLWNTIVVTDQNGEATQSFATSDAVTTWRVHADAHTTKGTGRLGQASLDFSTRLPLHVDAKLPVEVSAGDRLQLPIHVESTDPACTEVTLATTPGAGLQLAADAPTRIALVNGRGRALLPVIVAEHLGPTTLALDVRAGHFRDVVSHRLTIAPRGFPHRRSVGGQSEAGKPSTGRIAVPSDPVPGSGRVTLSVYPSPIAALTQGLEGILQEPHGCFEQASS